MALGWSLRIPDQPTPLPSFRPPPVRGEHLKG
jgi:hypothetical protein